jgi:anti-sigma factor RsiW
MKHFWNKIKSQSFKNIEGEEMKCSRVKTISQYVDDELSPDKKKIFTSHIQKCPACKEELEEIQAIHERFASAERFDAPYGFATRVMAHLAEREETGRLIGLWVFFASRPFFLRTVKVAFALVILLMGMISGNLLMVSRTSGRQVIIRETFSLDLFQATPPDSVGGIYMRLAGVPNEK